MFSKSQKKNVVVETGYLVCYKQSEHGSSEVKRHFLMH